MGVVEGGGISPRVIAAYRDARGQLAYDGLLEADAD